MPALVRSAALTQFAELATARGLDPVELLRAVGLPRRCLDEPDLKVPAQAVGRLLELAAERAGEPAFGLCMAESRRLSNLGPLAMLVRDEPTLRSTLEALIRHIHLHNEALAVRVEQVSNLVVIRAELFADGGASLRQATELVVGVTYRVLQVLIGTAWHPRLVCFTHAAPARLGVHRRVLGNAVEFGHEFNGIVCNAADLDAANPGADPVMARYAQRLLEEIPGRRAQMKDKVRQFAVLLLPRGLCRIEVVAHHLGVDRRTVHRRLAAERTSFSAIVEAVRRDLATRYVEGTEQPLQEVAALLGFAAPSAFSRWHSVSIGTSPVRRRAAAKTAAHRRRCGRSRTARATPVRWRRASERRGADRVRRAWGSDS